MISDFINKQGNYIVRFENFFGSGWSSTIEQLLKKSIKPTSIKKEGISVSWDSSQIEFYVQKDEISFKVSLDDESPNAIILEKPITEENKKKLREWAIIIAEEVEKLNA